MEIKKSEFFKKNSTEIPKINNIPYREKRTIRSAIAPGNIHLCQMLQFNKERGYYVDYQPVLVVGKTSEGDVNFLHLKPTANANISKEEAKYKAVLKLNCEELPHKKYYVCANKIDTCADELFFSKPLYKLQEKESKIYSEIELLMEQGISTQVSKYIKEKYDKADKNSKNGYILQKILDTRIKFLEKNLKQTQEFIEENKDKNLIETAKYIIETTKKPERVINEYEAHRRNQDTENPLKKEESILRLNNMFSSSKGKTMRKKDIERLEQITNNQNLVDKKIKESEDYKFNEVEQKWAKYGIPILPNQEKINLIQPGLVYPCEIFAKNGITKKYEIKSRPVIVIGQVSKNEVQIIHITTRQKLEKEDINSIKHIGHILEKDRKEQNKIGNVINPLSFSERSWINAEKIETVPIENIIPVPTSYFSENKEEYRNRFLNIIYNAEKNVIINASRAIKRINNPKIIKRHKAFLEQQLKEAINARNKIFNQNNEENNANKMPPNGKDSNDKDPNNSSDKYYGSILINKGNKKPPKKKEEKIAEL